MIKSALEQMFSAKTLTLWIVLALIALIAFFLVVAVTVIFHINLEALFQSFLAFLGIGGGAGTTRNVISDGIAPRVPMAIGARTDPSVALGSPTPMSATVDPPKTGDF